MKAIRADWSKSAFCPMNGIFYSHIISSFELANESDELDIVVDYFCENSDEPSIHQ